MHSKKFSFQEIIVTLQQYWAKQGCIIVQPCRRPTDGRYGATQSCSTLLSISSDGEAMP